MPGVGKTTIGNLLSKKLDMAFIDTDVLIKQKAGKSPQQIIDEDGASQVLSVEENVVLDLNLKNFVVSTGGSVVYSHKALNHLKNNE
jgi:shikimate kinase